VQCPEVEGSDKLVGQMLEVEVASLTVSWWGATVFVFGALLSCVVSC
jgi:hypothetical protein